MKGPRILIDANRRELSQHGSADFPLAVYRTAIKESFLGFIDWHWHAEMQFCLVTKGEVRFYVNYEAFVISAGDGLFINAGQLHRAEDYQDTGGTYICIDVHPNFITGFAESRINTKYVFPYVGNNAVSHCVLQREEAWQRRVLTGMAEIGAAYEGKENGYELQLYAKITEIWKEMVLSHLIRFPLKQADGCEGPLKSVLSYIHEHYNEKIELEMIAREVNMSKSACCRKFKKDMNLTVFEYLNNYRLTMSAYFLESTNDSITEIAYKCGFAGTSYFIARFKERKGMSPTKYRKTLRG